MNVKRCLLSMLVIALVGVVALSIDTSARRVTVKGPASDRIEYVRVERFLVPNALKAGDIDVSIFSILPDDHVDIGKYDPDIELWEAYTGMDDLLLNPAPAPPGELNPFTLTEVRYALNFITDRKFLVESIFNGCAMPLTTYMDPNNPEYVTVQDIVESHNFTYNFDKANDLVTNAMTLAGATKIDKWIYNGNPVTINAIIRVEDERKEFGEYFASQLELLGFTVNYNYMTFGPAIELVYGTDPEHLDWHYYTEGWGLGASRWNTWEPGCWGGSADPDIGDWCANMPGFGVEEWWQYYSPGLRIETLSTDINYGRYADEADREAKMREVTDLIMQESVRIFGIRELSAYASRREVKGLTQDLGLGLRGGIWAPREAYKSDTDSLTFGNQWIWTEELGWNLYGGFDDIYSVDIARSTYDPLVWRHPFTASAMPFRSDYLVITEGPDGTLDVPPDANIWDASTDEWTAVGSGVEATSKVVFDMSKYIGSKWHHGLDINWADTLYYLASGWELADDAAKSVRESSVSGKARVYYDTIQGVQIIEDSLVVYVNYYHFDENEIAFFANPYANSLSIGQNPWELMAAQENVVFNKELLSMDRSSSDQYDIPMMSLVLDTHAGYIAESLTELLAADYFPASFFTMGGIVYDSIENAHDRYQASIEWYDDKGIIWISNGPFFLNVFDANAQYAETLAFRDPNYPFEPGDWYYGRAPSTSPIQGSLLLQQAEISYGARPSMDSYDLKGELTLGIESDGLDLTEEGLWLEVGTDSLYIPPGHFTLRSNLYNLNVNIDGVDIKVKLRPIGENVYQLTLEVENTDLSGTSNPTQIEIRIGNDIVSSNIWLEGRLRYKSGP